MSTLELKELSAPTGEVIKIAAGKTLDLKSQGSVTMPTGSVLQVVQGTLTNPSGGILTSSTSYISTSLTATITPISTSSKILVMVAGNYDTEAAGNQANFTIYRGASNVIGVAGFQAPYSSGSRLISDLVITHLDSPSTTSATAYTLYLRSYGGTVEFNSQGITSTMTLMEIQG